MKWVYPLLSVYKGVIIMTKYREILRLASLGFSNRSIALSVPCSRNTVAKVLKMAQELKLCWPLQDNQTDEVLEKLFFLPALSACSSAPAHGVTGFQFLGDARCLQHTGQHGIHALLLSKWLIFFSKALLFHPWCVSCDSHEAQAQAQK